MLLRLIVFVGPLLLAACTYDTKLSASENLELQEIRKYWSDMDDDSILKAVVYNNPEELARQSIASGDDRLIGLAMGYKATEDDVSPFGVKCEKPTVLNPVVFGCVPPPMVVFKQITRYNLAVISSPNYSNELNCVPDTEKTRWLAELAQ